MAGFDGFMNGLRTRVQQAIGDNALVLSQYGAGPQTGSARPPETQWWNLPAKYAAAQRIKADVLRNYPGWNDAGDAARHAEPSRRMASEIDPTTAFFAGAAHEAENTIPSELAQFAPGFLQAHARENWHGQGTPERLMDERNNAEGRRAAREHRLVDPARLQTSPAGPVPPSAPYQQHRPRVR